MTSPNADLLRRLNQIKANLSVDLLTPPQMEAYEQILEYIDRGEPRINLHGPSGVGKTVVSWVLAEEHDWEYLPDPDTEPSRQSVIYDHASPKRAATRRLRADIQLNNLTRTVYVTRVPAKELYPRVNLDPDLDKQKDQIEEILAEIPANN
jgi:hypothetical protein